MVSPQIAQIEKVQLYYYFNLEDFEDINKEYRHINIVKYGNNQYGLEIEHVPSFHFLDIMLDEKLSWKSEIKMVDNKISKVTGILYRLNNVFRKMCCLYFIPLLSFLI